ncbi:related to PPR repeat [Cephalotrichum gorgonifer]|uniref:Related to PPR repeat n=1 Tax=Cephalotrichum gorgonifer TaxID=2041049 RepID=A0AAE8N0P9_9PEZI|nr:related to PPR repeat [Cephalotrichum gorgonifer]
MPAPYSSLYQNLIRSGLSKSVTYGYAQSVVAVSHPHLLNQNRPSFGRRQSHRFSRLHTLHAQAANAFHTERQALSGLAADKRNDHVIVQGGLDAYFEALKTREAEREVSEGEEEEWSQFEFQKRIEWKPTPASILLGESKPGADGEVREQHEAAPKISPEEEAVLAHIDAALENAIEERKLLDAVEEVLVSASPNGTFAPSATAPVSRSRTPAFSRTRTPVSVATPVDPMSQTYADHLYSLSDAGRFKEIPPVFEAMLVAGVRPIASAYNALLLAAIQLSSEKNEVVSKALDVYADMLRRKVSPDGNTYDILVNLLASRSLEVSNLKKSLEAKRVRYGGLEEFGKFMLASHELEFAILCEDDRLDLAMRLFDSSVVAQKADFSAHTYAQVISACAAAGRVGDMLRLFEHMEVAGPTPVASIFPAMITAFAKTGDLVSAVECYNEYKGLAIANDHGESTIEGREDALVYASVINAYVISDKLEGAKNFYQKISEEYGVRTAEINNALVAGGFVDGLVQRGVYQEALQWALSIEDEARTKTMARVAIAAADKGDKATAVAAFAHVPLGYPKIAGPSAALLALSVREGDVAAATQYWHILSNCSQEPNRGFIEPTVMYAVGLMLTGQVGEGLTQSEIMFDRIRAAARPDDFHLADEIDEGVAYISRFMGARGITDPRETASQLSAVSPSPFVDSPYMSTPTVSSFDDTFDPYAHNTDFKGSSLISDELEGSHGRRGRLSDALARFRNIRRSGRHPRYITYAKLISAAARDGKFDLCNDILAMARSDVPLLPQYAAVRYGWSSILDAMIGACLNVGNRGAAEKYHQELLNMGATPTANTYGLYITTMKESTKTFDEATEAVKIFHRARAEGVEPSSFLYNALIGKLGKARRIDDCLFYFSEMRGLGVKPTSVTYGTIVNALCRVSDEKLAEDLFEEMESMPNYKARPAPYNSMMQFFLTTKRDKSKVLAYYDRMVARGIAPTSHTYKLLIDTHASLEPVNMDEAETVMNKIRASGMKPEPVHYASLIHARGCVLHDMENAQRIFDSVVADNTVPLNASIFQALLESMVANHRVSDTEPILELMQKRQVELTPYIANTLIHGWAAQKDITKARAIYDAVGREKREPSTYEAMTRAFLAVEQRDGAQGVVREMLSRGYPSAVVNKVLELLGGGEEASASA